VGATLESVRGTVRGFVADIIRKNAPEATEEQLASLLDEYAPGPGVPKKAAQESVLPPQAILSMVLSFVEFAEGKMAPSRQAELWQSAPRWQDEYWAAFPAEVKALVAAYIEGRITGDTFGSGLLSLLGL
jgi:hypothetical protein